MSTATADAEAESLAEQNAYLKETFGVVPRPYQVDAFTEVCSGFEAGAASQLIVMATGTGKTVVMGMLAKECVSDRDGRVLLLSHRGELQDQMVGTFTAMGLSPVLEKADEHACPHFTLPGGGHLESLFGDEVDPASDPKCVVASVQTMQGKRLLAWPPGHFDDIYIDECHHAASKSYRTIIAHLKPKRLLGVTATWDRADKKPIVGIGQPFERKAFEYSLGKAVREGWLARPVYKCLPCDIDLSEIRTTAGDLNAGDLEAAIKPHIQKLVNECLPYVKGKVVIGFTPDVGSAEAIASAFRSESLPEDMRHDFRSVSGADKDREKTVAEFKAGMFPGLMNCQLLTEGFDHAAVDTIIMFRPTKSRGLFMQMIGRGTRLYPGKERCRVIGFNWQTFKHKIVRPVEIYDDPNGDPYADDVLAAAQTLLDSGECAEIQQALKRAEPIVARQKLQVQIDAQAAAARACDYDPIDGEEATAAPRRDVGGEGLAAMATQNQMDALTKMGYDPKHVVGLTKMVASAIMNKAVKRREQGLASYKQTKLMKRMGYHGDVNAVSFTDASSWITANKKW